MPLVSGSNRNRTTVARVEDAPKSPKTPAIPIPFFITGYNFVNPNSTVLKRQKIYPPHSPRTLVGRSSPIMSPGSRKKPRVLKATYPRMRVGGVMPVPGPWLRRNARPRVQAAVPIPETITKKRLVTRSRSMQARTVTASRTQALAFAAI